MPANSVNSSVAKRNSKKNGKNQSQLQKASQSSSSSNSNDGVRQNMQGLKCQQLSPICALQTAQRSQSIHDSNQLAPSGPSRDCLVADREESEDSVVEEVIMAIDMKQNGIMSCAYFSTIYGSLYLSDDVAKADDDIAEQLLIHAQPTTVLASGRAPERFLIFLEKQAISSPSGNTTGGFNLRFLQSSEFSFETARGRLMNLFPGPTNAVFASVVDDSGIGLEGSTTELQHLKALRCGSSINLNSNVAVGCAGAVLGDLQQRESTTLLPDGQAAKVVFNVHSIHMFSLSKYMFINTDALQSLQIMPSELRPNSQISGLDPNQRGTNESLSVYGLFHSLACTPQGRSQLRQIFLRPSLDIGLITERQQSISAILRPDNAERLQRITATLRKIRNLRTVMSQLQKGIDYHAPSRSFEKGVWGTIRDFTARALELREIVGGMNGVQTLNIVHKLFESLDSNVLLSVGEMVSKTIDFDQSKARHRSSVKTGVDAQLDSLKRAYDGMENYLDGVVRRIHEDIPEWARKYVRSCIFLPQLGFLTLVKPDLRTGNGQYEGEGSDRSPWEKMFVLNDSVCYKNDYMTELDEQYGDMYCKIGDREVEIIHDLARRVLECENTLAVASDTCGELDSIVALALGAQKSGWKAPRVIETSVVEIKDGRHPLQELVVPLFIPNDCSLKRRKASKYYPGTDLPQVLVLAGPNHSGKSVYLKQVAIIVYLAHIGSFVPASQATIGLTDKILTRISTRESMSGAESAFAIDLKQVALSTKYSTSRSLILVDEFGKGTNPDDGAGLLAAMLDHFLSLNDESPRLLVATHFHEVFEEQYLVHHGGIQLAHMDVRVNKEAMDTEDQVTYLFKLTPGHNPSSFGSICAELNGVPCVVVRRAEQLTDLLSNNEDLNVICTQLTSEEEEILYEAEKIVHRFLEQDFPECQPSNPTASKSLLLSLLQDSHHEDSGSNQ